MSFKYIDMSRYPRLGFFVREMLGPRRCEVFDVLWWVLCC